MYVKLLLPEICKVRMLVYRLLHPGLLCSTPQYTTPAFYSVLERKLKSIPSLCVCHDCYILHYVVVWWFHSSWTSPMRTNWWFSSSTWPPRCCLRWAKTTSQLFSGGSLPGKSSNHIITDWMLQWWWPVCSLQLPVGENKFYCPDILYWKMSRLIILTACVLPWLLQTGDTVHIRGGCDRVHRPRAHSAHQCGL